VNQWMHYRGTGTPDEEVCARALPAPPPWRVFTEVADDVPGADDAQDDPGRQAPPKGSAYQAGEQETRMINAAMYLRRPLLVTGKPGVGKSSLAYSVARELCLGPVLRWPVTSRSTLRDGLYQYDAIGRLQDANLRPRAADEGGAAGDRSEPPDIGNYVRLGPLGTALLPSDRPRVLLVDELDKADIDLPNDLLDVFEEGEFEIPELSRLPEGRRNVSVMTADPGLRVAVTAGHVRCREFPLVILTSNGEREFPPAFLRRCLKLAIAPPDREKLVRIVEAHLGTVALAGYGHLIDAFLQRRLGGDLAADQLLNSIHLSFSGLRPDGETVEDLSRALLPYLSPGS
jgi:MoxR-like ATPase